MRRRIPVIDVFCGSGGASTGFEQAGGRVVVGFDHCPSALETFRQHHPEARTVLAELGGDGLCIEDVLRHLPHHGPCWVHLSPPCQGFSQLRMAADRNVGTAYHVDLMQWSLELISKLPARATFSLEQVNVPATRALVEGERQARPDAFDWMVLDSADFACPQRRRRLWCAPPRTIARLKGREPTFCTPREILPHLHRDDLETASPVSRRRETPQFERGRDRAAHGLPRRDVLAAPAQGRLPPTRQLGSTTRGAGRVGGRVGVTRRLL